MNAGRLYIRPVEGTRGHVVVGIATPHLGRVAEVEARAFDAMIRPVSDARYKHRLGRWRKLRAFYVRCLRSWERAWGLS